MSILDTTSTGIVGDKTAPRRRHSARSGSASSRGLRPKASEREPTTGSIAKSTAAPMEVAARGGASPVFGGRLARCGWSRLANHKSRAGGTCTGEPTVSAKTSGKACETTASAQTTLVSAPHRERVCRRCARNGEDCNRSRRGAGAVFEGLPSAGSDGGGGGGRIPEATMTPGRTALGA
eukprot:scaffold3460_cov115-Isochrysis_galbana.AAC.7